MCLCLFRSSLFLSLIPCHFHHIDLVCNLLDLSYFIFFGVFVNGIVCLCIFRMSIAVNAVDFCALILYPLNLLNSTYLLVLRDFTFFLLLNSLELDVPLLFQMVCFPFILMEQFVL